MTYILTTIILYFIISFQTLNIRTTRLTTRNAFCGLKCNITMNTVCRLEPCRLKPYFCLKVEMAEMTDASRTKIRNLHNDIRTNVASGKLTNTPGTAADINIVSYSKELEFAAQCWANVCSNTSDFCRITPRFGDVGQSIYITYIGSDFDPDDIFKLAMDSWMNEIEYITPNIYNKYIPNERYEHFTQILWGKTKFLGCGRTLFDHLDKAILVCNYAPAGNIEGQSVYTQGTPCTLCICPVTPVLCGLVDNLEEFYPPFHMGGDLMDKSSYYSSTLFIQLILLVNIL